MKRSTRDHHQAETPHFYMPPLPEQWLLSKLKRSLLSCIPAKPARRSPLPEYLLSHNRPDDVFVPAPSVEWLLANREEARLRYAASTHRMVKRDTDSPLASLYRMYQYIVVDHTIQLRNEFEYFFNHGQWLVASIPDPADPDPARYAILAVLPLFLVFAFNKLINKGIPRGSPPIVWDFEELAARPRILEEPPGWIEKVPPLQETLAIPDENGKLVKDADDSAAARQFLAKNILAFAPNVLFT